MLIPDEVENDHIEKADMLPPQDPEGEETLVANLLIEESNLVSILTKSL